MLRLLVTLFRMLPILIIVGIICIFVYAFLKRKINPDIAKEFYIKLAFWINLILGSISFLIVLYAMADHNNTVIELAGACLILFSVIFIISAICRAIFLKNRPDYPWKRINFRKTK